MNTFLTDKELAARWNISVRTVQKWRVTGQGPRFRKLGTAVRYALPDVEAYEQAAGRRSTSDERG